jgi:hypothetical protein
VFQVIVAVVSVGFARIDEITGAVVVGVVVGAAGVKNAISGELVEVLDAFIDVAEKWYHVFGVRPESATEWLNTSVESSVDEAVYTGEIPYAICELAGWSVVQVIIALVARGAATNADIEGALVVGVLVDASGSVAKAASLLVATVLEASTDCAMK